MIHTSFCIEMDKTTINLARADAHNSGRCNEKDTLRNDANEEFEMIEEYFSTTPANVVCPDLLGWFEDSNELNKMAAVFSTHDGPVCGLSFSQHSPSYLISGASEGKVAIWDVAKTYYDTVPTSEYVVSRGDISFISWNPCMANVIATSSCSGETIVMDLGSKDAIVSKCQANEAISTCQWAPFNSNQLLTATGSCCNSLPFILWDIRKTSEPIQKFGKEITGANYISFCPVDGDKFLASTDEDIYTWSLKEEKIVGRLLCETSCHEVHYRARSEEVFAASTEGGIRVYNWEVIDNSSCSDIID